MINWSTGQMIYTGGGLKTPVISLNEFQARRPESLFTTGINASTSASASLSMSSVSPSTSVLSATGTTSVMNNNNNNNSYNNNNSSNTGNTGRGIGRDTPIVIRKPTGSAVGGSGFYLEGADRDGSDGTVVGERGNANTGGVGVVTAAVGTSIADSHSLASYNKTDSQSNTNTNVVNLGGIESQTMPLLSSKSNLKPKADYMTQNTTTNNGNKNKHQNRTYSNKKEIKETNEIKKISQQESESESELVRVTGENTYTTRSNSNPQAQEQEIEMGVSQVSSSSSSSCKWLFDFFSILVQCVLFDVECCIR